jgi:hypothetical protein
MFAGFSMRRRPVTPPGGASSIVNRLYPIVKTMDRCGVTSHAIAEWRDRRGDFGGTKLAGKVQELQRRALAIGAVPILSFGRTNPIGTAVLAKRSRFAPAAGVSGGLVARESSVIATPRVLPSASPRVNSAKQSPPQAHSAKIASSRSSSQ